jgi:hypothetical protein
MSGKDHAGVLLEFGVEGRDLVVQFVDLLFNAFLNSGAV